MPYTCVGPDLPVDFSRHRPHMCPTADSGPSFGEPGQLRTRVGSRGGHGTKPANPHHACKRGGCSTVKG